MVALTKPQQGLYTTWHIQPEVSSNHAHYFDLYGFMKCALVAFFSNNVFIVNVKDPD